MKKFPKIKQISDSEINLFVHDEDPLFVLEKMDGANFRWTLKEDRILSGSRNVEFKEHGNPLPVDEINKQFRHVVKYLQETVDFEKLREIEEEHGNLVFFGEAMHEHTVEYDAWDGEKPEYTSEKPNYLGFDIWNESEQNWVSHDMVIQIHEEIGLDTVPVIEKTTVGGITDDDIEIPKSEYRTENPEADSKFNQEGLAEGIVVKNDATGVRGKKVADYMSEVNMHGKPSDDESLEEMKERKRNARRFVDVFVTEARIRKTAHKLVDEGHYEELEMPMMKDLPKKVIKDVFAEEGWEILNNEYGIDLTEDSKESIRQLASKKCSRVLKDEIQRA